MEARRDARFMRQALGLARRAIGRTAPNPVVGAVMVKRGRVIGQGYHRRAGLPHAEVEALRRAGARARGATLYVTLEPCTHTGRTPPCCDALVRAGIRRVVIAMRDPNPLTNGRGIARLRRAGMQVTTGVLADEAHRLNAPFTNVMTMKRPLVVVKIAQSLDGKIATRTGESRWISSARSRALVQRLRRQTDAILVGINTILRDDPRLSVREGRRPARADRPLKVIVDNRLRTPVTSRCLSKASPAPTVIATVTRSPAKRARLQRQGAHVLVLQPQKGRVPLRALLRELAHRFAVMSVLLEGGGEVVASAFRERVVDRVVWCVAPTIIGGRRSPSSVGGEGIARLRQAIRLSDLRVRRMGDELMLEASVVYPR